MAVDTYDVSDTWTCPAGVTEVQVECWGEGASGTDGDGMFFAGRGGGGGAYAIVNAFVTTPGNGYGITIGAGNSATKTLFDTSTCIADYGSGENGGLSGNSTGDTTYSGGNGGNTLGSSGDGGGGAAGTNGAGGNASGSTGGTPGTDGGAGGDGGVGSSDNGVAGSAPGGGGGGGGVNALKGAGAAGRVRLTYTAEEDVTLLLVDEDGFAGVMNTGCADINDGHG